MFIIDDCLVLMEEMVEEEEILVSWLITHKRVLPELRDTIKQKMVAKVGAIFPEEEMVKASLSWSV